MTTVLQQEREALHSRLAVPNGALTITSAGVASIADNNSKSSIAIAKELCSLLSVNVPVVEKKIDGQKAGRIFEVEAGIFVDKVFPKFNMLRPGNWEIREPTSAGIAEFKQYKHLAEIEKFVKYNEELKTTLGGGYLIKPDLLVIRRTEQDFHINKTEKLVDNTISLHSDIRETVSITPILHASISLKWTIRSDRVQNSRSEALNLIRYRKGRTPHIAVLTGEPTPSRLAAIALGTGDVDCVYHFALYELREAVERVGSDDAKELLKIMIEGARLKDISDLPLDLAV